MCGCLVTRMKLQMLSLTAAEWSQTLVATRERALRVDAYLVNAARAGQSYAALVYNDQSNVSSNGMTVATPPLQLVETRAGFKLMRSLSGKDHYVIASELSEPR